MALATATIMPTWPPKARQQFMGHKKTNWMMKRVFKVSALS